MAKLYRSIGVTDEVKQKVARCKETFLSHNPKFKQMRITDDFILNRICDYYND